ncbi:unnamed protein product [Soboliphyme baturini]|uniref:Mcl1_mid domain-containing protein n=1 Tax=Soboliphyme baturini TaxID=241478 RepID=A0A183IZ73_9BILA|nr:unnamed protein product [Soboliphyme baturini]
MGIYHCCLCSSGLFGIRDSKKTSICCYSSCGEYLAAAFMNGAIAVWEVNTKQCLQRLSHPKETVISCLIWNPSLSSGSDLLFCDVQGFIGGFKSVVRFPVVEPKPNEVPLSAVAPTAVKSNDHADNKENDYDSDIEISCSTRKAAKQIVDDEDSQDSDIGAIKRAYETIINPPEKSETDFSKVPAEVIYTKGWEPTEPRKPFMPGAMPERFSERYLMWNSIGIIKLYNSEEDSTIDVEFHDTSFHHSLHFSNTLTDYSIGDVSAEAVAFASRSSKDSRSTVNVIYFSSWDSSREWSSELPDDESVECLCLGRNWLAVVTDKQLVRLFLLSGTEIYLFEHPGNVLAVAGWNEFLMVAYSTGVNYRGEGFTRCALYQVRTTDWTAESPVIKKLHEFDLVLREAHHLVWMGFTKEGSPSTVDSDGTVRILSMSSLLWTPVLVLTTKHEDDKMWVVGVIEKPPQVRVILCKASEYPKIAPRPPVLSIPWKIPLCDADTERSNNEHVLISSKIASASLSNRSKNASNVASLNTTEIECLLKLFAMACKSERLHRAYDIAQLVPSAEMLQPFIKYASRVGRLVLADRVTALAESKVRMEEERQFESNAARLTKAASVQSNQSNSLPSVSQKPSQDVPSAAKTNGHSQRGSVNNGVSSPADLPSTSTSGPPRNPFKVTLLL